MRSKQKYLLSFVPILKPSHRNLTSDGDCGWLHTLCMDGHTGSPPVHFPLAPHVTWFWGWAINYLRLR